MATANPEQHSRDVSLDTGALKHDTTRKAQARTDAENAVRVNISEKGAWYHGINGGDELAVLVFEEGIWISTTHE